MLSIFSVPDGMHKCFVSDRGKVEMHCPRHLWPISKFYVLSSSIHLPLSSHCAFIPSRKKICVHFKTFFQCLATLSKCIMLKFC